MGELLRNNRFYILIFSGMLAIGFYLYIISSFQSEQLQIIRLTQYYALTATAFLYLTLLVGPLSRLINGPFIQKWLHARRALGISALCFSSLHGAIAFFGQLGGFEGLPFLGDKYLLGITLSFIALLILALIGSTSFDFMVAKLKFKRWKRIHQLVYIAAFLILVHALLLGTHFHDLSEMIPFIFFTGLFSLLLLHALCWEKRLQNNNALPKFGLLSIGVIITMTALYFLYLNPQSVAENSSPLSIHSQHVTDTNNQKTENTNTMSGLYMPGMEGDKGKRFNVQFSHVDNIQPNQQTKLDFKITDSKNGDPVYFFQTPFEKPFHLIIVNSDLSYFSHIHPTQQQNTFTIDTSFPKDDSYHIYNDFQPFGAVEQQYAFQLKVGNPTAATSLTQTPSFSTEKKLDNYTVRLKYDLPLKSNLVTLGKQELHFEITDNNNNPVTNLFPYLGAFGHLVMIKQDTFEYVHAHPVMTKPVQPTERSGPEVTFIPMALYGEVTPGIYKVFAQFNPNGNLITVDFWIKID